MPDVQKRIHSEKWNYCGYNKKLIFRTALIVDCVVRLALTCIINNKKQDLNESLNKWFRNYEIGIHNQHASYMTIIGLPTRIQHLYPTHFIHPHMKTIGVQIYVNNKFIFPNSCWQERFVYINLQCIIIL